MITKTTTLSFFLATAATATVASIDAFTPSSPILITLGTATSSYSRNSVSLSAEKKKIFIDGEAGTTGLQVRDRLSKRTDLEIISISEELRKDKDERKRLINEADCVILCK